MHTKSDTKSGTTRAVETVQIGIRRNRCNASQSQECTIGYMRHTKCPKTTQNKTCIVFAFSPSWCFHNHAETVVVKFPRFHNTQELSVILFIRVSIRVGERCAELRSAPRAGTLHIQQFLIMLIWRKRSKLERCAGFSDSPYQFTCTGQGFVNLGI